MGAVVTEGDKLGRYTPRDVARHKTLEAELEVGRLASEVSDEHLQARIADFRATVRPMVEQDASRPAEADLRTLREQYEAALTRVAELQRELD